MAQAGFTPIQLYRTATPSTSPTAGNLSDGELAINTADGKLFYKDSGGVVQTIATKAGANGDVVGPASATDGNLAAFDGTTGKLIKQAATVTVAQGGTGLSTTTAYGLIAAGTTATGNFQQVSGTGTSGQLLTSNGAGALPTWQTPAAGFSAAADNTFTGTQTFAGTSSKLAEVLTNAAEVVTVSATAATGTINYNITTQSVLYYTSNASANWTVNFRASSGTSLNTALATGQSVTVAFLVTQGSTAYYNNVVQVDGSSVTPKWQGGTAPTAGNASSIDVYAYTIIKTGAATFTVLASQTKFA